MKPKRHKGHDSGTYKLPTSAIRKNLKCLPNLRVNCYKDGTNNPMNLHINYSIMSLLKGKITPKSESKLYNYKNIKMH